MKSAKSKIPLLITGYKSFKLMNNSKSIVKLVDKSPFALLLLILLFPSSIGQAQGTFHKLFKVGGGSLWQLAFCTTEDQGAVAAFHRAGGSAVTLGTIKVDNAGNQVWSKGFALSSNSTFPVSMAASPDSGVVMALLDPLLMDSIRLMKLDRNGNSTWSKSFRATYWNMDAFPLFVMADGSVLFAHSNDDSLCLKKMTSSGQLSWSRNYKKVGSGIINPSSLLYHDSCIYIGGYDAASYSSFLVKTDKLGNIMWQREHAGAVSAKLNMLPVQTGGVIISTVFQGSTTADSRVALFRPDGTVKWAIKMPFDQAQMCQVSPKTFALSVLQQNKVKTVIVDTFGSVKLARSSYDPNADLEYRLAAYKGQGFWICGINGNNLWMMRSDTLGNTGCFTQLDTVIAQSDSIWPTNMSLLTVSSSSLFASDTLIPQTLAVSDSIICSSLSISQTLTGFFSCYPNPVFDELIIRNPATTGSAHYKIVSPEGKLMAAGTLLKTETVLKTSNWSTGLYFLTVEGEAGRSGTFKIVKR
jgi:hypothetical protein